MIVPLLLDRQADVHAQGGFYGTALQAASAEGHEKIVQLLLDPNADVHALSFAGSNVSLQHWTPVLGANANSTQLLHLCRDLWTRHTNTRRLLKPTYIPC